MMAENIAGEDFDTGVEGENLSEGDIEKPESVTIEDLFGEEEEEEEER